MKTLAIKGEKFQFQEGYNLLEILKMNNIIIENPCNGKAYCGKCKVKIINGLNDYNLNDHRRFLSEYEISNNIRLACMYIPNEDIEIDIMEKSLINNEKNKILESGYIPEYILNPSIKKKYKESATYIEYNGEVINKELGDTRENTYGFAVDIGSTTIVASMIDLYKGEIIGTSSCINPQKIYGLDVMSRINYAKENGVKNLKDSLIDALNELFFELSDKHGYSLDYVYDIVISANTTMTHILLGESPEKLGKSPYTPAFTEAKTLKASEIGLLALGDARVYSMPLVSGFIGGDIVSGAIVSDLANKKENTLFIDIGTNGEILLSSNGKLVATSCAAGPALEGMNISCGIRAKVGAIEEVKIENSKINFNVIGDIKPIGICGSGIIDAICEFKKYGIINKLGRITKKDNIINGPFLDNILIDENGKRNILLSKERNIRITQKDIREVQLAKGAILSGILALCSYSKININDIEEVIIAGQFGAHLKIESLIGIGILPKEFRDKTKYIGNSSQSGAILCLLNNEKRKEAEESIKNLEYIELSKFENYEKLFSSSLNLEIN